MPDRPIRRALLSVWDKSGLTEFAKVLAGLDVELISTGGTATALREAGLTVRDVADVTGTPGILDGRVKTLHPAIHGGILARRDLDAHVATIEALGIPTIDLVAVNLYPFEATIAGGADEAEAIEMIDVGGPAMMRSAAKNHGAVTVVTDPGDYDAVLAELHAHGGQTTGDLRRGLAAKAFARTASYDAAIAAWFAERLDDRLPERLTITAERRQQMRYGENPHQRAAFYATGRAGSLAAAEQVQGKALSYNNLADADAASRLVAELDAPAVAIVKHANPCGVAVDDELAVAYDKALACDPISAYGGIIALNRPLDRATAEHIVQVFTEVVIAPDAEPAAREVLAQKVNLRLLLTGRTTTDWAGALELRSIAGGLLIQETDTGRVGEADLRAVTKRAPTASEIADLLFAFTVAKHVKSNAIVLAKGGATIGIGAGQMSRLDSVRIAVQKAAEAAAAAAEREPQTQGSVVASDAFFPFPDGLEAALAAGVTAAIQPGGSMRDDAVIAAADEAGAAMVFTGIRHFRH